MYSPRRWRWNYRWCRRIFPEFRKLYGTASTACWFRNENPVAVADAIETLIRNPEYSRRLGMAARATICGMFDSRRNTVRLRALLVPAGVKSRMSPALGVEPAGVERAIGSYTTLCDFKPEQILAYYRSRGSVKYFPVGRRGSAARQNQEHSRQPFRVQWGELRTLPRSILAS